MAPKTRVRLQLGAAQPGVEGRVLKPGSNVQGVQWVRYGLRPVQHLSSGSFIGGATPQNKAGGLAGGSPLPRGAGYNRGPGPGQTRSAARILDVGMYETRACPGSKADAPFRVCLG